MNEQKLREYEEHFKSNIESPFELEMIMELIDELRNAKGINAPSVSA